MQFVKVNKLIEMVFVIKAKQIMSTCQLRMEDVILIQLIGLNTLSSTQFKFQVLFKSQFNLLMPISHTHTPTPIRTVYI